MIAFHNDRRIEGREPDGDDTWLGNGRSVLEVATGRATSRLAELRPTFATPLVRHPMSIACRRARRDKVPRHCPST